MKNKGGRRPPYLVMVKLLWDLLLGSLWITLVSAQNLLWDLLYGHFAQHRRTPHKLLVGYFNDQGEIRSQP